MKGASEVGKDYGFLKVSSENIFFACACNLGLEEAELAISGYFLDVGEWRKMTDNSQISHLGYLLYSQGYLLLSKCSLTFEDKKQESGQKNLFFF